MTDKIKEQYILCEVDADGNLISHIHSCTVVSRLGSLEVGREYVAVEAKRGHRVAVFKLERVA